MRFLLALLLVVTVGCGGDVDREPIALPTTPTPAPAPEPPPEPPTVPAGLRVSASGEDFIEWIWNAVEGADGYDVQFSLNEAFASEDEIIARTAEELSYRREGLAAGTSAFLRVRSASGSGEGRIVSDWSTGVTGMTLEPPPPPEPPGQVTGVTVAELGQDFVLWTWDPVEGATGYEAAPYLAADPEGERSILFVEEPFVRVDGFEPDTAVWIHVRAVRETAGGRAVGEWSNRVLAETWGEPRECTYERDSALMYIGGEGGVVAEWDGTPIPVDYLPDFPDRQFILDELDKIEALADAIERHAGYRIVERGTILDDFTFPDGWREEPIDYRDERAVWSAARRPLDQIPTRLDRVLAVHYPLTVDGGCHEWASPRQGIIGFSTCLFADPPPLRRWPDGTAVIHELFHVLGFDHSDVPGRRLSSVSEEMLSAGIPINRMSAQLDFVNQFEGTGPPFTWDDLEALRCIFPPMSAR